ncbi:MAG TPA: oxygen-independent coproporphyrinogen III oxidase [Rhodothermales bacterium]|nr:oxygen-independent coproporphyrinogen III oxidase [Rhodothermales bacterium]
MEIVVDLNLVSKYDRPGPRYTSYPTAPHFSEEFQSVDWESHITENNRSADRPVSLYFHFPFCDTLCWFCGCTVVISRRREPIEKYVHAIFREIELYSSRIHPDREIVQIHFGGGTPTHLTPVEIRAIGRKIHEAFRVAEGAEISCEMDPRGLTLDHLQALRDAGFNRASLGVQDFEPAVQQAVNRIHDEALVGGVLADVRRVGFESINLDLIYGLPHQTVESFEDTIEKVLSFDPDRLAVFSYAHVPWLKPHQRLIKPEDLPPPEQKLEMLKLIVETLTRRGYDYIGMDHFAKVDDDLARAQKNGTLQRNFQGYSTFAGADIYALGMSSISQLPYCYAQNTKDLGSYYAAIAADQLPMEKGVTLSEDDFLRRFVIMRLMCDMGLDYEKLSLELDRDVRSYLADEIEDLEGFEEDGLLEATDFGFKITPAGRLMVRNIAMTFDAYLVESNARYSRTV